MKEKRFRIGGINECLAISIAISLAYNFLGAFAGFPLIDNVLVTFICVTGISFVGLSILEIFWFEKDLDWNGKKKKNKCSQDSSASLDLTKCESSSK